MQLNGRNTRHRELLRELLRPMFRTGEQQRTIPASGEFTHDRRLVGDSDSEHVVGHRVDRCDRRVDRVHDGSIKEALHEYIDAVVERRREQQSLPIVGRRFHETANGGKKSEIGHVIRLIEHRYLDAGETAVPLLDQVFETARARDNNVDSAAQRSNLRPLTDTAEDRGEAKPHRIGEGLHHIGHLIREFPRRDEH